MPRALCRANMEKIRFVLGEMETVLGGLTRGLDLHVLDAGWTEQQGRAVSYLGLADALGVVLPSNSPGVHSLWLPAIPLKVPLMLKPGSREPWTPLRICQALLRAGCPPEALGYYPTDPSGATEILLRSDRSMLFGDVSTVAGWRGDPRVQLHGPGWSKVLLGADLASRWCEFLEVMAESVAANGGRSCLNASGIWTAAHGREIAQALARRLHEIPILPLDHPQAAVAAFSDPQIAWRISEQIDQRLEQPGAVDVSAELHGGSRVVETGGCTFLRPTVIRCDDPDHSLARAEYLFPFVAVVELPQPELLRRAGETLVATAITEDEAFQRELLTARNVDRLNLGAIPTGRVSWDQPHEGNLFEHLYHQRALQSAG
jgi:acyl-CoA reductase-like NAD-dependent aldehyde dehydrogenase